MSDPDDPLFVAGRPNPDVMGFIPLRSSGPGAGIDESRMVEAARRLGHPVQFVDADGYQQEIVAASAIGPGGELAYVISSAKQSGDYVDVSFTFVLRDGEGRETSSEVESYNPYFGCDVHFLEWFGRTAVLIYREKHKTYVATCPVGGSARYLAVDDCWLVDGDELVYWRYKEPMIDRLSLPALSALDPITPADAEQRGILPEKFW